MPKIRIISIGTRLPDWTNKAVDSWLKRISRQCFDIQLVELAAKKRKPGNNPGKLVLEESKIVLDKIPGGFRHISLDRKGKAITSDELSARMRGWMDETQDIAISIGGPDGFPETFLRQCDDVWSLSALTLAHPVARIVMAEQLYRGYAIMTGHPYHRGERY